MLGSAAANVAPMTNYGLHGACMGCAAPADRTGNLKRRTLSGYLRQSSRPEDRSRYNSPCLPGAPTPVGMTDFVPSLAHAHAHGARLYTRNADDLVDLVGLEAISRS